MSKLKSPCSLCGQEISESLLASKRKLKAERVSEALQKAKELGEPVGRPKIGVPILEVVKMRKMGYTLEAIAELHKCSEATVRRRLAEKENG